MQKKVTSTQADREGRGGEHERRFRSCDDVTHFSHVDTFLRVIFSHGLRKYCDDVRAAGTEQ